jgi:hypothetical protein
MAMRTLKDNNRRNIGAVRPYLFFFPLTNRAIPGKWRCLALMDGDLSRAEIISLTLLWQRLL